MCLWWSKREPIESSFDPRFGSAAITAPTSGAFTDPSTAPPLAVAVLPTGSADQPAPSPPMSTISQLPKFPDAKPASLNLVPSNRSSETPSIPQPLTTKSAQSHHSRHSQHSLSTSTQFSSYNSTPSSPASQLQPSPQWPKTSSGTGRPSSPVPVHQAYIPADQLSIGSKLSPGFSASSAPTPTTNGPRTGNSTTTTVTNGWSSAQPSPTNIPTSSMPPTPASSPPLPQLAEMQGEFPSFPQPVQSIVLPAVDQQQAIEQQKQSRQSMQRLFGIQGTQASHPQSKARMTRIALPSLKLGAAPKRRPAKPWEERSPESDVEQWPGSHERVRVGRLELGIAHYPGLNNMEEDIAEKHLPRDIPIRVLADISTSSLESIDKFQEVRNLLDEVIPIIFQDPTADTSAPVDVNLLAIEIRGKHTFAIFDAHHEAYDFLTAHEPENNQLSVYRVRIKKRSMPWIGRAPNFDQMINGIVSELHRLNGYEVQPPYCRYHMLGPITYSNPRGMKMASVKEAEEEEDSEQKLAEEKLAEEKEDDRVPDEAT
ncbi:hypothetical protein V490_08586 [Pseudogymnoascus sp. VKM F-3557]|nr:hypothetical protein V490_08586 [Pseudogymnoascus sp. VKM F-3557]